MKLVQAIGSALVAVLTKSIAVMKAAAKAVAVSRAELRTNMTFPFFMSRPLIGPRDDQCMGRAK
jgi:ABC-type spermidine/putrescine transport system permease subunit II